VDPLTHILLGGSLGFVAFRRKLGRTAALVGGLAAFVPDGDVFIRSAADPLLAVEYHRHFTHSLLFAPIGAAIVSSFWLLRRKHRANGLFIWLCATTAYLSHCLLDAATSYGTQLLWPLSNHRFGWDFVSVIDLFVTIPLAIGFALALRKNRPGHACAALSFAFAYIALGAVHHQRASEAVRTLAASRGHAIERIEVMPTIANNLVWRALYIHDDQIHSDRVRVGWFSGVTLREGWSLPQVQAEDLHAAEAARDTRQSFARFAWFSENWVARSPGDPSVLGDMRYSLSAEAFDPIWGIRFTSPGASTEVEWVNRTRERKISARDLWTEISGADPRFHPLSAARTATFNALRP
jgi:inner membrane protein